MDGVKAPTLLVLTCWTLFSASSQAQDLVDQMRNLLEQGYYNSAAQLNGPDLVNLFPDDPQARYLYAYALYLTGRISEARVQLDLASTLQEQADPVHTHLNGLLKAAEGDPDTALTLLREAFHATQAYPYAMDWGRVAWQVGAYEEALEAYEAAATTEGGRTEPWPHLNRGRLLAFQSRYEEVIKALEHRNCGVRGQRPGQPSPLTRLRRSILPTRGGLRSSRGSRPGRDLLPLRILCGSHLRTRPRRTRTTGVRIRVRPGQVPTSRLRSLASHDPARTAP